jgi:F0F1-type ATP synthase membrane subunit b/b'
VDTTSDSRGQAADVVDAAKQTAQQQVGDVAQRGRGAVRRQVDQRSTQVGEQAWSAADALRQTASQIRAEGDPERRGWRLWQTKARSVWSG